MLPPLRCFRSGHTTAATFICGTLLFVLLPVALQALEEQQRQEEPPQQQPGERQPDQAPQLGVAARSVATWLLERQWALWASAAGITATGRVLADAHWCSDVLAGALLGAALTAATAQLSSSADGGQCWLGALLRGGDEGRRTSARR